MTKRPLPFDDTIANSNCPPFKKQKISYDSYVASINGSWEWKGAYKWHKYESSTSIEIDAKILENWLNKKEEKEFSFNFETGTFFNEKDNIYQYKCNG
eukprot:411905_1